METNENLLRKRISDVVCCNDAQYLVDKECRKYVKGKIAQKYPMQYEFLKPIMESVSYPLPQVNKKQKPNLWLERGILFASMFIGILIFNVLFAQSILGAVLGFIVGVFCVDKFISINDSPKMSSDEIQTHVDIVCNQTEEIYNKYETLCELLLKDNLNKSRADNFNEDEYPLENRYYEILRWLRFSLEAIGGNDWIEPRIKELLNIYGYDLVSYTGNNTGYFNMTQGHVEQPTTSLPALININTRRCIIQGHVIMPL